MKYIVFQRGTILDVVLFAESFTHALVCVDPMWVPRSAGFFRLTGDGLVSTYHWSESLKLKPHRDDELLIELRLHGSTAAVDEASMPIVRDAFQQLRRMRDGTE